jgi:hypothetical protein
MSGRAVVSLYDLLGKLRIQREVQMVNGTIKDFQLGIQPNGIYMVKVDAQGNSVTSKLIIQK